MPSSIDVGFNPQERKFLHTLDRKFNKVALALLIFLFFGIIGGLAIAYNLYINRQSNDETSTTPQATSLATNLLPDKNSLPLQNGELNCPLAVSFCSTQNIKEASLSANLTSDTPIYAAFDGTVDGFVSHHENLNHSTEDYSYIILNNSERGLQALYYYQGDLPTIKTAKKGDQIATLSGKPVVFMENKSLVFQLIFATSEGGQPVTLKPEMFAK